jgi:hypothetical protein
MAIEETVVIKTDTKSLADLRKEISQIQAELDLTPSGTKEYDALVVKLRQAKGEIKDFKEATKGLDPDQRAAKLVNAFRGMTGAIQAAAGAITLFGGSGKELEEVEKNLLGIIAIGGGVQSTIEGFNDAADVIGPAFTGLGNSIKGAFTTASGGVNTFRVALASIGIGVAIIAITKLLDIYEDYKQQQEDLAAQQAILNNIDEQTIKLRDEELKKITPLLAAAKNENISRQDRVKAIKAIQSEYPDYLKNQNLEKVSIKDIEKANEDLVLSLTKRARAQAALEKLGEIAKKQIEIGIQLANTEVDVLKRRNELAGKGLSPDQINKAIDSEQNLAKFAQQTLQAELDKLKIQEKKINNYITENKLIDDLVGSTVTGTQKTLTAAEKEVIAITNATALKQRAYEQDIENLKKARNKELEGAIDSATKREGIGIKYDALEVERGKKLGNDLLQIVKDSEKRLVKADETVLIKRAETQLQGNKIINQQNLESINAAIKDRENATKKSNEQILENLQTNLTNAERTLEQEQSIYGKLIEEYKQLNVDNYEAVFDDQDKFYSFLVDRLKEYGVEVNRETAEQIRQRGLAEFKANEESQLLQDQFFKQAIDALRKNGEEGNAEADRLEKERKAKFDQNQQAKLDSAISYGQQEIDVAQDTSNQIVEIQEQAYSSLSQFANDYASLQSTLAQNQLDRELYALNKRTEARIQAAGDDAEAVGRIQKDSILLEDDLRRKAFENEKQRKLKLSFINEATAVLSILAETPKADFGVATALLIAGAIATARLQQQAIRDTQYIPSYAEGGLVTGLGTSTSDSILARLSNGEFVVNAKSTQRFLPVLNTLNGTPNNNQLSQTIDSSGSSPMFRTYVLAGDVTSAQAAEARLNQKRKL